MKTIMLMMGLLLSTSVLSSTDRCTSGRFRTLYLGASVDQNKLYSYDFEGAVETNNAVSLGICRAREQGRYLSISTAMNWKSPISEGDNQIYKFDDLPFNSCQVTGLEQTANFDRGFFYQGMTQAFSYLDHCLELEVRDGPNPVRWPKGQENCAIQSLPNGGVLARGRFCKFNVRGTSTFTIIPRVDPRCKEFAYLKKHQIPSGDANFVVEYSFVDDPSMNQGKGVGRTFIKYTQEPKADMFALTDVYNDESPRLLAKWNLPAFKIDAPTVIKDGEYLNFSYNIYADNFCPKTCLGRYCASNCDLSKPLAYRVELHHKKKGSSEFKFVEEFFKGHVLTSNWKGILQSNLLVETSQRFSRFKPGDQFRLKFIFDDPKLLYDLYKKRRRRQLLTQITNLPTLIGDGEINEIPGLEDFLALPGLFIFPSLNQEQKMEELIASSIKPIELINSFSAAWPSFYESVCAGDRCVHRSLDGHTQLLFDLEVDDSNEESITVRPVLEAQKSKLYKNYINRTPRPLGISCEDAL